MEQFVKCINNDDVSDMLTVGKNIKFLTEMEIQ